MLCIFKNDAGSHICWSFQAQDFIFTKFSQLGVAVLQIQWQNKLEKDFDQTRFTEILLDDGPSLFFLKVSKTFHKTANSFSVYIFLSLIVQSSKMRVVFS